MTTDNYSNACTHDYHQITQSVQDLTDSTQQNILHSLEGNASPFTDDTDTHCDFSIIDHTLDTENTNDIHPCFVPKFPAIHSQRKHAYRDTFGDTHIQYHDFDNQDSLTFRDKYTALLQQELQNPYWNLHDPITTKSYKTKREQLQSWNILSFNPKTTDVDEHIDLINTLGDMVDQKEEAKKEKS